jgi:4-alpha-glucanotransferase
MRKGRLLEEDYPVESRDYHIYVQWVADQQMQSIRELSQEEGVGLYLDLPLGVHPDGYDVWRNQHLFAQDVSGGAPPDSFFTKGQNWGFRPLHPERSRLEHHTYFRQILAHLTSHSDLMRIDHVMSLHRLYWVPAGFSAEDGVYVHYPREELFAILALESHRQKCVIVGEDLGTVPTIVRKSMADHGIHHMYVSIFEFSSSGESPLNEVPADTLASMNTHDTATFAAFCQKLDIEQRRKMNLLDDRGCEEETSGRDSLLDFLYRFFSIEGDRQNPQVQLALLKALLSHLGVSKSRYLLLNLEDLWLETLSQNVPGTGLERPNWRNKVRFDFEEFSVDKNLLKLLRKIDSLRRRSEDKG